MRLCSSILNHEGGEKRGREEAGKGCFPGGTGALKSEKAQTINRKCHMKITSTMSSGSAHVSNKIQNHACTAKKHSHKSPYVRYQTGKQEPSHEIKLRALL